MSYIDAIIWLAALGTAFFMTVLLVEGLCFAASRPTPSPLDRVADYSEEDDLYLDWKIGGTD